MKVWLEKDNGVFLLLPENDWEGLINLDLLCAAGIGGQIAYGGRMGEKMSPYFSIKLMAGKAELVVAGGTEADKRNIARIRSLFFHSALSRMALHGFAFTDYGLGLVLAAAYCINCGRPMNERVNWKICRNCAEEICEHPSYGKRMISDDEGVFLCKICLKCGLPDPVDMLRASSFHLPERLAEIQKFDPKVTFVMSENPGALPLTVAVALRANN